MAGNCPNGYFMGSRGVCIQNSPVRKNTTRRKPIRSNKNNNANISGNSFIKVNWPEGDTITAHGYNSEGTCDEFQDQCYEVEGDMAGPWFGTWGNTVPPFCACSTYTDYVWNANNVPDLMGIDGCIWYGWIMGGWGDNNFWDGIMSFFSCMGQDFSSLYSNAEIETTEVYTMCQFSYNACVNYYDPNRFGRETSTAPPGWG